MGGVAAIGSTVEVGPVDLRQLLSITAALWGLSDDRFLEQQGMRSVVMESGST